MDTVTCLWCRERLATVSAPWRADERYDVGNTASGDVGGHAFYFSRRGGKIAMCIAERTAPTGTTGGG